MVRRSPLGRHRDATPGGEDASLTAARALTRLAGTASARILAAWLSALPEVDSGFATCLRESMYTVAFRPPPGRGSLRVRYPFIFRPEDSGAGR
nr:hypothetical protein [Deltaproteobacteria bacterium]